MMIVRTEPFDTKGADVHTSPVPVQFDWDKIRTDMKPIKMAGTKA